MFTTVWSGHTHSLIVTCTKKQQAVEVFVDFVRFYLPLK